jgi:hypothetical protein
MCRYQLVALICYVMKLPLVTVVRQQGKRQLQRYSSNTNHLPLTTSH